MSGNFFIKNQKGQSLLEILVGLGIISVLIGATTYALVAALKTSTLTEQTQTAGLVGSSLIDSAITLAEGNWNNVYNLAKGSANHYYIVNSPTTTPYIVAGNESVLSDNITNGLVGHWKFDELSGTMAYDSSGQGNFGQLVNSPTRTLSANCKVGSCLTFDGTNYINISVIANNFLTNPNSFTFTQWIKTTQNSGQVYTLGNAGGGDGFRFGISSGKIAFLIGDASTHIEATCGNLNANDGNWHMIGGVFDRTNLIFYCYLDGVNIGSVNLTSAYPNMSLVAPKLAKPPCCTAFVGQLDDVRVYNRALSATEIAQLYNSSVYNRYFYVDNVNRTACGSGNITTNSATTCTGSANDVQEDPSTQKITVGTTWNIKGVSQSFENSEYVTRWINSYAQQSGWGGSSGVSGAVTSFGSNYYDYSNISTTTTGAIKITGF